MKKHGVDPCIFLYAFVSLKKKKCELSLFEGLTVTLLNAIVSSFVDLVTAIHSVDCWRTDGDVVRHVNLLCLPFHFEKILYCVPSRNSSARLKRFSSRLR